MMFNVKKVTLIVALFLVCALIFVWFGCIHRTNPNVRLLIVGDYTFSILLEITDENVLRVNIFRSAFHYSSEPSIATFNESLLNDFRDRINDYVIHDDEYARPHRRWLHRLPRRTRGVFNRGEVQLSEEQSNIVRGLIENVTANNPDREFEPMPFVAWGARDAYVWAIIDDEMYWTFFPPGIRYIDLTEDWVDDYINWDLFLLVDELIELSPIPVRAEEISRGSQFIPIQ